MSTSCVNCKFGKGNFCTNEERNSAVITTNSKGDCLFFKVKQMPICPTCLGEGELPSKCEGDCYHGPHRACTGPDEGHCEDGIVYLPCPDCDGTGNVIIKNENNVDVKMHRLSAPKLRKLKIVKSIKPEER